MRLIVVDDHPQIISAVTELLRGNYDIVATSGTGSEGIEAIAAFKPDAVVLDISIPGLSGLEVAQR